MKANEPQHSLMADEPSTSGRPIADEEEDELFRVAGRLGNAIIRAAATGCAVRGGIHALSWIFALLLKSKSEKKRRQKTLLGALEDTVRYTAFLGSLAGVYVSVDEGLAWLFGRRR